jgi:hypothetical protein
MSVARLKSPELDWNIEIIPNAITLIWLTTKRIYKVLCRVVI